LEGSSSREDTPTRSADLLRWISAGFFVLFVASTVLFFPRPDRHATRVVRASRPLSLVTGPLWAAILMVVFLALLVEAIVPDWVYGGALTVPLPFESVLQGFGIILWLAGGGLALWSERNLGRSHGQKSRCSQTIGSSRPGRTAGSDIPSTPRSSC
jgi:protein-S-isoprenylcysteine O-methyltransferase Ste14